jgi:hypothetical protein
VKNEAQPAKTELIHIYCDESRQCGKHRFMLLGGIWIPASKEIEFSELCSKFRSQEPHLLTAFFKWEKATSTNFSKFYKQFVDLFFSYEHITFNCMVIDTHKVKYDKFHQGDRELAFYKFYFFLLSRNIQRELQSGMKRHLIMLDKRSDKKKGRLLDLKVRLNNYFFSRNLADSDVISNVEPRDCRLYNQMQLVDIFIGAIGYVKEGYNTCRAKLDLVEHIDKRKTTSTPSKFNIWEWQPSS